MGLKEAERAWLIPAHAGKTRTLWPGNQAGVGSSPLTRGKPHTTRRGRIVLRLIPAHAGKTGLASSADRRRRAHPRSRGENLRCDPSSRRDRGSSPLTRGKRRRERPGHRNRRLIPAHAGKTDPRANTARGDRAHPRSRGENTPIVPEEDTVHGSSPLTRGKPALIAADLPESGLIPAHAGKTHSRKEGAVWAKAHPRSRGENEMSAQLSAVAAGSSPLTRGKPSESKTDR